MTQTCDGARQGVMAKLETLRSVDGARRTVGLPDDVLERFAERDPTLRKAIDRAYDRYQELSVEYADFLAEDEEVQVDLSQHSLVNFYGTALVNPYVALAADGPWIVTTKGAVIHDSGGYGMLGQGHAPDHVLDAMSRPQAMANVMTPSISQMRLIVALKREIGHRRTDGCPFPGFIFLNSGSESVTVAARIADANAKIMTDPGGRHEGKPIRRLSLHGSFHGRTHRPASFSHSGSKHYREHLASFRDMSPIVTVPANDLDALRDAFDDAEADGVFIEAFFMEPVMGEGNPGVGITRPFYDLARQLTAEHGAMLFVDSIQAGLRAHGVLSVVDYPGFEDCVAPDLETYSKALNAGQYPLSVLAMNERAARLLQPGLYGNTMTASPRAMEVGAAVLESITPELRENIRERGCEFYGMLTELAEESDGAITAITGTGLLIACALDPERFLSHGENSVEEYLRTKGFGVIHGGTNALRYTPHFAVTTEELELIVEGIRDALENGPRL
ncbi:MAG: aminotransferase class III-fold pyridoxal phosphate-dependent enzyme [Planctomycetota bacterium]|nr:aminotransferase class III-fold pyridoxal phosphate-dependent enzyme [Planctomycetota bacterium]